MLSLEKGSGTGTICSGGGPEEGPRELMLKVEGLARSNNNGGQCELNNRGGGRDLMLKVESAHLVRPAEPTPRRTIFLSNIDQTLVATVELVLLFSAHPLMTFDRVVEKLAEALARVLVPYDFMAGRLKLNVPEGRLEIDCNGAGALFRVATSPLSIADVGVLNPSFKQLILPGACGGQDFPLFTLQATAFECGAFALAAGINHTLLDGVSAFDFMVNLASFASGSGLSVSPDADRTLLRARRPPSIEHEHLEYTKLCDVPPGLLGGAFSAGGGRAPGLNPGENGAAAAELELKLFSVSGELLGRLKERATQDGLVRKCTAFEVVTAHLWRARTLAMDAGPPEGTSTVLFPVDIRARMDPPLPRAFAGNAVFPGYAKATLRELREQPLSFLVRRVQEGLRRVSDGYVRSAIDWLEVHRGIPCASNSFSVVSWWRLGLEEVEFPWGKPFYLDPVMTHSLELVMLLPGHCPLQQHDGLNVAIALEPRHMPSFQHLLLANVF